MFYIFRPFPAEKNNKKTLSETSMRPKQEDHAKCSCGGSLGVERTKQPLDHSCWEFMWPFVAFLVGN